MSFTPLLYGADNGWTVGIDPTSHAVVERVAGATTMPHRTLVVSGVPSLIIEQNPVYLAWHDLNSDAIPQANEIQPMTTAEKTAFDAPKISEQARQQAFADQITNDAACSGELSTIDSQIDAAFASASTVAQVKTVAVAVLKRIARCVRARAR